MVEQDDTGNLMEKTQRPQEFTVTIDGITLQFSSEESLFSPHGADKGTLHMLAHVEFTQDDVLLDLGCGYGLVGIYAAKKIPPDRVFMTDIDPCAVRIAQRNAISNQVEGITLTCGNAYEAVEKSKFTQILTNPPYHADFSVAKAFIEKGFNRLAIGGKMYMVTKRKEWYKNKMIAIFGGVRIWEEDGYYVFLGEKKAPSYAKKLKK